MDFPTIGHEESVPVAEETQSELSLIVNGRYMVCPRCREEHDVLRYVPMGQVEEFKSETVPVYRCPNCRWIFAPAARVGEDIL